MKDGHQAWVHLRCHKTSRCLLDIEETLCSRCYEPLDSAHLAARASSVARPKSHDNHSATLFPA